MAKMKPHTGFRSVQKALQNPAVAPEAPAVPSRKMLPGARKMAAPVKLAKRGAKPMRAC